MKKCCNVGNRNAVFNISMLFHFLCGGTAGGSPMERSSIQPTRNERPHLYNPLFERGETGEFRRNAHSVAGAHIRVYVRRVFCAIYWLKCVNYSIMPNKMSALTLYFSAIFFIMFAVYFLFPVSYLLYCGCNISSSCAISFCDIPFSFLHFFMLW